MDVILDLHRRSSGRLLVCLGGLAMVLVLLGSGCSRTRYRQRADADAYRLVNEKRTHPHWSLPGYSIEVDPRSRMHDPFDPDRPPMPPDDDYSHEYMHLADNRNGYPWWHRDGDTGHVENPCWLEHLPLEEDGVFRLDAAGAVRVALINSPTYQRQLETLYLSALDVSAERFAFDLRFFAGYGGSVATRGVFAGGSDTTWQANTRNVGINKVFTTGATLIAGFANTLTWQIAGPDTFSGTNLFNFAFTQPLLRLAGRDRIMETLTLAERGLLANVRSLERYRRGFFMDLYTGSGGQGNISRLGGFSGGSGITSFTGVGVGGFGGVGAAGGFGGGGVGFGGGGTGAGSAGGYLGLLQLQQNIRNQETNIASLRSSLALLTAFRDAGRIDFFQVEQVRQQLFESTSQLLNAKFSYQNTLDAFKSDLGLPPQLNLRIEDRLLSRFYLIDPSITPRENQIANLQEMVGTAILTALPDSDPNVDQAPPQWRQILAFQLQTIANAVRDSQEVRRQILEQDVVMVLEDLGKLERALPDRRSSAERLKQRLLAGRMDNRGESIFADVDQSLFDVAALSALPAELRKNLGEIEQRLKAGEATAALIVEELEALPSQLPQLTDEQLLERLRDGAFANAPGLVANLSDDLLDLSLVQARARAERITLPLVEMESTVALEIARCHRRDWMNNRASLVDSWRRIQFNADRLQSDFDVFFTGSVGNVGDSPSWLDIRTGTAQAGFRFDAPIQRLVERNVYRQSLIEYQQAKRSYYQFQDSVAADLRVILRQVEVDKVNFELRRTALQVAVAQVQLARLRLQEPPAAEAQATLGTGGGNLGPTTAQNLITALNSLRSAQDDFLSVWVDFEVQRGLLDLQLGTMQLDTEGLWIDPGPIGLEFGYPPLQQDLCPTNECIPAYARPGYGRVDGLPDFNLYLDATQGLGAPNGSLERLDYAPGSVPSEGELRGLAPDEAIDSDLQPPAAPQPIQITPATFSRSAEAGNAISRKHRR